MLARPDLQFVRPPLDNLYDPVILIREAVYELLDRAGLVLRESVEADRTRKLRAACHDTLRSRTPA